jgi:hypothetical protein
VICFEFVDEPEPCQSATQGALGTTGPDADLTISEGEVHLVTWRDPEPLTKLLWDHDLALRADPMSHTKEYN